MDLGSRECLELPFGTFFAKCLEPAQALCFDDIGPPFSVAAATKVPPRVVQKSLGSPPFVSSGHSNSKVTPQVPQCEPEDAKIAPKVTETGPKDSQIVINAS